MSERQPRVRAIRGATTLLQDAPAEIVTETATLLQEMMARNRVEKGDLISIMFTATPDLRSEFPAAGARKIGISDIPLICAREIDVEDAVPRCIRILMHVYTARDHSELRHVYLGEARQLRTDLRQ